MKIGIEVFFELAQCWKLQDGIKFDSVENFFKTLSINHYKKYGCDTCCSYELRKGVRLYNILGDWQLEKDYLINKEYGDESKVPLHSNVNGVSADNFRLIDSVVTDKRIFYVRNSLEYAKDIAPFMAKNFSDKPFYCDGRDNDNPNKNEPLLFKVGYDYGSKQYVVYYTYLVDGQDESIIITADGYQLWPQVAEKKRPDIFKQILSNKKEEIIIRKF